MQNTEKSSLFSIGKKALALALCLVMALSLLPATALAAPVQLSAPTDLTWERIVKNGDGVIVRSVPGMIGWCTDGTGTNVFDVKLYNAEDPETPINGFENRDYGEGETSFVDGTIFILNDYDSGTYFFTVQEIGDGTEYTSSEIVKSKEWKYDKPTEQLEAAKPYDMGWSGTWAVWTNPEEKMVERYYYEWYYSETADGEPEYLYTAPGESASQLRATKDGYYYYKVRALSGDITKYLNSDWSEFSTAYHLTTSVLPVLEEIAESSTDIRSDVQGIDTEELVDAMISDTNNTGVVKLLGELEEKVGGAAEIFVAPELEEKIDASNVSVVGANLNNSNDSVTLYIGSPSNQDLPTYMNSMALSIRLKGVEKIDVPVKVMLPVPYNPYKMGGSATAVYHYNDDGTCEKVDSGYSIIDGKRYISLVLTSVGDFVFTDQSSPHEHNWKKNVVEATCESEGGTIYTCSECGKTYTEDVVEALGHELKYSIIDDDSSIITETCSRCGNKAKIAVVADNAVYNGEAIEDAKIKEIEGVWLGEVPTVTYENNVNAGTATAKIAVEGVTASVEFTIAKADKYTITLGNLSQYTNNLGAVTATVEPKDDSADIIVEYGTEVAGTPCTHEHTEECSETCTHTEHNEECGFAEASTAWSTTAPTAVGTYKVRAHVESSDNFVVSEETSYTEGTLEIRRYVYVDPDPTPVTPSKPTTPATPEPEPVNAAEVYNDVEETDWYIESVNYVVENGLMNGYDEETFAPNDNLSRAMLMTIIARIDGVETDSGENWYKKGMDWAVENGISDGSNPLANITREQLVTMLYRYIGSPEVSGELNFKDVSEISGYAVDAMTWAVQNGIIQGSDVGTVNPQSNATRAEAAAILARFCENVKK